MCEKCNTGYAVQDGACVPVSCVVENIRACKSKQRMLAGALLLWGC